ncbi:serine/threonine-protein kinase [Tautonia plasticadhaerens]|uniref:non-specific serine/threonine protein kinase n=1 Tax=Tautonia plasticadhaerens TaxID=2527974 RepID=A0A518HF27_9BACT|nr:serine/threonine-protein kinase [Tautonia plasticadhaerens]QDV39460.1 Serine/threonine-protein kinase PknB [Tautonia plasticadhaerens]
MDDRTHDGERRRQVRGRSGSIGVDAGAPNSSVRDDLDETIPHGASTAEHDSQHSNDRRPPELPDDYEIRRELGRGGMGVVYLAWQKSLGREVAVKVLRGGQPAAGPAIRRFLEEARHLARLRHPHIVAVHEVGRDARGEPYFTMDFVDGEPLTALLAREGRLQPGRAVALIWQAAEAVRHAHEQGLIHRDLKPGNILADRDGRACVTDFGLARDLAGSAGLTGTGELMGTPAYMAPEQALGQADLIGEATDVHALGAVLYEMLAGRPPYGNDTPARVLARILDAEPTPLRRIDRRIPRDLETICLKAMAKDPARRYGSAAFLGDLRRFETGLPSLARRPGPLLRSWSLTRRHWKTPAVAVSLTAAILGSWAAFMPGPTTPPSATTSTDEARTLVAAGDEHHEHGDHALAARFYTEDIKRSGGDARPELLARLARCVGEVDDVAAALEVAMIAAEQAPDLSFGRHDELIARILMNRASGIGTGTIYDPEKGDEVADVSDVDRPVLQLASDRIRLFLDGPSGTPAKREEAEQALASIERKLRGAPLDYGRHEGPLPWEMVLPEGTIETLRAEAADPDLHPLDRGKAAYVLGTELEAAGRPDDALTAYRDAYELVRPVFPFYAEEAEDPDDPRTGDDSRFDDEGNLQLLPIIVGAICALDPDAPDPLQGGVLVRLEGVTIPDPISQSFTLRLVDAEIPPDRAKTLLSRNEAHRHSAGQLGRDVEFLTGAQRRSSFRSGRIRGWKPRTSSLMIGVSGGGCGRWT